ncbi:MAG TPA: tRNA epoxyqueuosine(34) reductase QueG [Saprospiraceae bacterium]|nr:tRNA epoxyqueuosine(34) reductase QueG [Saprospiraceae bacterium]HNT21134.1 tRNA epoxyqueuosine(34) reductase QueG [Saprospiraceae bacterium]
MNPAEKSAWIKSEALKSGFLTAGIARAEPLNEEQKQLEAWLRKGYQGDMSYMERNLDKRVDPAGLVPGAKSVISLAYNYYTPDRPVPGSLKISTYAYGRDYHKVLKKKLKALWNSIRMQLSPDAQARYFVDSAPVMERQWAARAGLGWLGKNTLLIHPGHGSFFFLAEIITDLELEYDEPTWDHCGTCTRCIDACPTQAIAPAGYELDARRCISYLTIETQNDIPEEQVQHMEGYIFGCDICQQVCPWNRFSRPHEEPEFEPGNDFLNWNRDQWIKLDESQFAETFGHSPVRRAGYDKLKRTIGSVMKGGKG